MLRLVFNRKLNMIILGAVLLILLIVICQGININYKVEGDNIRINWFSGVDIHIKDIYEIKVLDKVPGMTKITGLDIFNIRQGVYSLEGIGKVMLYANDINRKMILIRTSTMTYGLTPEDTQQFVKSIAKK